MHTPEIRPIVCTRDQSGPHRIFPDVLPLLRVALAIAHSMMKPARLKSVGRRCCAALIFKTLGGAVFPKRNPAFDGEFQIARSAEEMQVIGHEQIIADE